MTTRSARSPLLAGVGGACGMVALAVLGFAVGSAAVGIIGVVLALGFVLMGIYLAGRVRS